MIPAASRLSLLRAQAVLAVLCLTGLLAIGSTLSSLGVYIPVLKRDEGWAEAALAGIGSSLLLCSSLSTIMMGALIDRLSPTRVIATALSLIAIGCFLAAHVSSVGLFAAAFGVVGVGIAGVTTPSIALVTRLFDRNRGIALAFYFGSITLGGASVPQVVGVLVDAEGWRPALELGAVSVALCCPLVLLLGQAGPRLSVPGKPAGGVIEHDAVGLSVKQALRSANFWLLAMVAAIAQACTNSVILVVISYFAEGGISLSTAVRIYSLLNLVSLPSLFLSGMLADRLGPRKVLPYVLLIHGVGTLVLVAALSSTIAGWFAMGLFVLLFGFASGICIQIGPMLLAETVGPRHFGSLLGIYQAVVGLVGALAPMEAGWLREISGSYKIAFIELGILVVLAAPAILLVKPCLPPNIKRSEAVQHS